MTKLTEKAIKLIEGKNFAYIATLMKDGSPQVTPVWIDHQGRDALLVNTAVGRAKQKNLERDPRVAIAIGDSANQYEMVAIRGKVVEQTRTGADDHIDKLAKKYMGVDEYPYRNTKEKRIILKIKPEHVSG